MRQLVCGLLALICFTWLKAEWHWNSLLGGHRWGVAFALLLTIAFAYAALAANRPDKA